jgi:hypothetical protein
MLFYFMTDFFVPLFHVMQTEQTEDPDDEIFMSPPSIVSASAAKKLR